ncbi:hypothetical protein QQ045_000729 [Rhodiola kirilowii]
MDFKNMYENLEVLNGCAISSDHSPLIVELKKTKYFWKDKLFTYEAMWHRDEAFKDKIKEAWSDVVNGSQKLVETLERCADQLDTWNKSVFGKVEKKIKEAKKELQGIRAMPRTQIMAEIEKEFTSKIDEWLEKEEFMWRQRSRVDWLKEGDRNTIFFHKLRFGKEIIDVVKIWKYLNQIISAG